MGFQLCDKVKNLTPYEPLQGEYRLRMDANESFLSLSGSLRKKVANIVQNANFNRYPDPYATELCTAFAEFYGVSSNWVTAGNGSDELIGVMIGSLLQKGETILTLTPDFSMYRFYGDIYENPVLQMKKGLDFQIDVDAVIKKVREENIKMLIFSNPCNPTSVGISAEKVRKLIQSVEALVVLDEAYMDFWNQSLLQEVDQYPNLIILKTCSKAIGLAALRIGFAIANATITRALKAVKSPYNVNSISQSIGAAILKEPDYLCACNEEIKNSTAYLRKECGILADRHKSITKIYEGSTNFVFLKVDAANRIYEELLKRSIAVRCFGDFLRISTDSIDGNNFFIQAFDEILQTLEMNRKGERL